MIAILAPLLLQFAQSPLQVTPNHPNTFYQVGDTVTWTIPQNSSAEGTYKYEIKKNNFTADAEGTFQPSQKDNRIEFKPTEPGMLFLQITAPNGTKKDYAAAIDPQKLRPVVDKPKDFDEFWKRKTDLADKTEANYRFTPMKIEDKRYNFGTFLMDHPMGGHITGTAAHPADDKKHPAMLFLQWAGGPYPIDPSWTAGYAQNGWIVMDMQPHDVKPMAPADYYQNLPPYLKNYQSINLEDPESNYFVRMYLSGYMALNHLSKDPRWDGKTLLVMGTSMGGQQSLALAGLHPNVTHCIANVPAGADMNAGLYGRQLGYPFFPMNNSAAVKTAQYIDIINFAPRIKATTLIGLGFVDTVCPPAGIWTAYNLIPGPKEIVPMPDSPHNHLATPAQQKPFNDRNWQWLQSLAKGEDVKPRALEETLKSAAGTR